MDDRERIRRDFGRLAFRAWRLTVPAMAMLPGLRLPMAGPATAIGFLLLGWERRGSPCGSVAIGALTRTLSASFACACAGLGTGQCTGPPGWTPARLF